MRRLFFIQFTVCIILMIATDKNYAKNTITFTHENKIGFCYDKIYSIKLLEHTSSCSIYELKDENGVIIYNIIAAIATNWLPDAVEKFCELTIGDPDICDAVYDVTSMLVALRGKVIYRGVSKGLRKSIRWISNRGYTKSTATIEATTYDVVSGVKKLFNAYKKRCESGNGIPWEKVETNKDFSNSFHSSYHSFYKFNRNKSGLIFGNRINFRTTPSIESYNKIYLLNNYDNVLIIGYQIPNNDENDRITIRKTYFTTLNNDKILIEKGIAVKYISYHNSIYSKVKIFKTNGGVEYGYISNRDINIMNNKKWYKIRYQNRIGWIYQDFLKVK